MMWYSKKGKNTAKRVKCWIELACHTLQIVGWLHRRWPSWTMVEYMRGWRLSLKWFFGIAHLDQRHIYLFYLFIIILMVNWCYQCNCNTRNDSSHLPFRKCCVKYGKILQQKYKSIINSTCHQRSKDGLKMVLGKYSLPKRLDIQKIHVPQSQQC